MTIICREESHAIIGACFEVYQQKGAGFLEAVYQECLEIDFADRKIPFRAHPPLALTYKGRLLKKRHAPDFICCDKIVVELKAAMAITDVDRAQLHNYLRATGHKLGLLINFGYYPQLFYERIVL